MRRMKMMWEMEEEEDEKGERKERQRRHGDLVLDPLRDCKTFKNMTTRNRRKEGVRLRGPTISKEFGPWNSDHSRISLDICSQSPSFRWKSLPGILPLPPSPLNPCISTRVTPFNPELPISLYHYPGYSIYPRAPYIPVSLPGLLHLLPNLNSDQPQVSLDINMIWHDITWERMIMKRVGQREPPTM